jgi:glycosyltransferase involved in cell wall biosynthesis
MLKVNFTVYNTDLYGGTRAIFEVANRLANRGYEVHITAFWGDHRWFPMKVPVVYTRIHANLLKLIEYYTCYGGFNSITRARNADIRIMGRLLGTATECDINIATWYPTFLPVWLSGKGRPYSFMQDFWEQMETIHTRKLFKVVLRLPFNFLANSSYTKQIVLEQQPNARVRVANVGVDRGVFYPRNKVVDVKKYPIVMAIIRGTYIKGDDIVIKVLNNVNREFPIHALLLCSSQVLREICKNTKIEFPYILYERVNDDELACLYSSADLFLFTSRAEGFGLPPLEAMSCGTPVVTTDCKGNKDYTVNNCNCLVAPPDDVARLKELTIKILKEGQLSDRLISMGLDTARKFTWDNTVSEFEEAFKEAS